MMNNVSLVGRLTKDPELRYTPNGVAVANMTLAINRPFKNQHGEHDADFINIVIWRKAAENTSNYMKKGSQVGVEGRLQSRTYENQNGQTIFVTEVVAEQVAFLESQKSNQGKQQSGQKPQGQQNQQQQSQGNSPFGGEGEQVNISSDDLPF